MKYLAGVREIIKERDLNQDEKLQLETYLDSQLVDMDRRADKIKKLEEAADHDG